MAKHTLPTLARRLKLNTAIRPERARTLALFLVASLCISWNAQAATPEASAISLAKAAVIDRSRDPTSVLFRNVTVAGRCNGVTYVHGWANGKNGYGGYSGFTIFLVRIDRGTAEVMQAYMQTFGSDASFTIAAACTKD
jgi:hypothetical protein